MENNKDSAAARALLQKYLEGKCNKAEQQQVLRWYYSFDGEDDVALEEEEKKQLLKAVNNNVYSAISSRSRQRNIRYRLGQTMGIAASLLLVMLGGLFLYRHFLSTEGKQKTIYRDLTTMPGERKMILLPDGSKIWLNNASKLRYPETFNAETRMVYLEGEAFFDVVHKEKQAFVIRTKKLKVQVLGTSFNIKSFADEKNEQVSVSSGKVAVSKTGESRYVMLLTGEQASYNAGTGDLNKDEAGSWDLMDWRNNELYFKYESLENICRHLERWYGVKILCNNRRLLAKKYTLKQKNQSLENVLKAWSAGDFHYKIKGRIVTIRP